MKFHLFIYGTVGRRHEIEQGMAGQRDDLYQRMLDEIAEYVRFADEAGYAGFGHPEHHLQIEGFELGNEPGLMSMFIGANSRRLQVDVVGWVAPTHNPVRTAESIATLDHMLKGRLGVGLVRGYQARWLHTYRVQPQIVAVGDWNRRTEEDALNRDYFREFVEIVLLAWQKETFSYKGNFWTIPPDDFVNPHYHPAYVKYGRGVTEDMRVLEVGIAPRPYQKPHPPLYGGFTHSLRTALFWAKYGGKPIVLASDLDFCRTLWSAYREEAERHGRQVKPGEEAAWGGILVVAEDKATAEEWAEDMRWLWREWSLPFGQDWPEMLIGDPDTVTRRLEEASQAVPFNECFFIIGQGVMERYRVLKTLELFAEKVMPRFAE